MPNTISSLLTNAVYLHKIQAMTQFRCPPAASALATGMLLLSLLCPASSLKAETPSVASAESSKQQATWPAVATGQVMGATAASQAAGANNVLPMANGEEGVEQQLLQQQLEQLNFAPEDQLAGEPIYTPGYLFELYQKNQFARLWLSQDNITQLLNAIAASGEEGLQPEDYHLKALNRFAKELQGQATAAKRVEYDLLLTDAMVLLGQHKRFGKVDPSQVEEKKNLEASTPHVSLVNIYLDAIRHHNVRAALDKLSPRHPAYLNLESALAQYKQYANKGGWRQIPAGPTLRPGMSDSRVIPLRHRLAVTGEWRGRGPMDSPYFDEQLANAVKAFQATHHIEPDGTVGASTLRALNITVTERINQIRVNLERSRWIIHDMPSSSLMVDIAGFSLQYYYDNQPVWSSKVMVGQPYHQTPIFRSAITYIVLNPTWTPTPDIVKNETVPSIVKDMGYLAKQRLRVIDSNGLEVDPHTIPWKQYQGRHFPYTVRQDPGKDNSLGLIKFLFPNPYHVYLHDTPSKSLFGRTTRAFSHGCIRVQNPLDLGRMILANDPGNPTTTDKVNQILASGKTTTVILKQPLPIYLMYQTTSVRDGKIMFKPDLYDRDEAILQALNAAPARLTPTTQDPEAKGATNNTASRQLKIGKTVKYVQSGQAANMDPNAQDSL